MKKKIQFLFGLSFCLLAACSLTSPKQSGELSYNKTLDGFEYPYPVHYYKFKDFGQDLKMAYMYVKSPLDKTRENTPTVVLLHGKNFSGFYWEEVTRSLLSWGYNVLIPDQIGFGKSSKPRLFQYSFRQLARLSHDLIRSEGIQNYILVGHSMGGMLATELTYLYPKEVQNLILLNPIGLEEYGYLSEPKSYDFFLKQERKKSIADIIAYQKKNYYAGDWSPKYEALTKIHEGWLQGPDVKRIQEVNALTYNMIFSEPSILKLPKLKTKVSLILGTRDRTGPGRAWRSNLKNYEMGRYDKLGKQIQRQNNNIKVYELEGLGHLPQIEDFSKFEPVFKKAIKN